jgi:16S rRNA (uracil1498-N3)-methyltransferase
MLLLYSLAGANPALRRRFFVDRFDGRKALLRGESGHHLGRVLRAAPGQLYELSDGIKVWLARVERVSREGVAFALVQPVAASEPQLRVTLLLSIVKFDRFEWCLEKATELGVAEVVPLAAARSDKALIASAAKRAERWRKILLGSAQQSRRLRPPELRPAVRPAEVFRAVPALRLGSGQAGRGAAVLLSERREAASLRQVLEGKRADLAMLAIGPEGGWTDEERAMAERAGFLEASLGPTILRTETDVIAGLAALNYALGDSGSLV